jgi:hypothetical protein
MRQVSNDLIVYVLSPNGQAADYNFGRDMSTDSRYQSLSRTSLRISTRQCFKRLMVVKGKRLPFVSMPGTWVVVTLVLLNPLSPEELRKAGVFWLNSNDSTNVFITRLHVRYSRDKFPEDLMFQETSNRQQFQGRYILNHPFTGR